MQILVNQVWYFKKSQKSGFEIASTLKGQNIPQIFSKSSEGISGLALCSHIETVKVMEEGQCCYPRRQKEIASASHWLL
jgi:hypothetical protein